MLKPWLGTWLSEVHYVFNTLQLHGTSKHLIIKLEKYPITVRKIKKRKETIKADYIKAPLVWLSAHPLWQNISSMLLHIRRQFISKQNLDVKL